MRFELGYKVSTNTAGSIRVDRAAEESIHQSQPLRQVPWTFVMSRDVASLLSRFLENMCSTRVLRAIKRFDLTQSGYVSIVSMTVE